MNPDFGPAARRLVIGEEGDEQSSKQMAERAANACRKLSHHLARLLGKLGVELLLERSVALASAEVPWLATASRGPVAQEDRVVSALQVALEPHEPEAIAEAFVAVLSALVELLERLIGEGLVERLLNEVWPAVFVRGAKDTP